MFDADALRQIFSIQSAAWTGVALFFLFVWRMWNGAPAMFAQWIAYRRAKAEEKAAHWNRLQQEIARLDESAKESRAAEARCNEELYGVKTRLATLEGYQAGYGRAAQEAAGIVAIERLNKAEKPDGPKGGGK